MFVGAVPRIGSPITDRFDHWLPIVMENPLNPGSNIVLMSPVELQEGIARLSRGTYFREASLDLTLSVLTESAAQMSGLARVSVWALTDDHQELRCLELFELSSRRHSSGATICAERYPAYFRALHSEDSIVADDAYLHPSTAEFAADYLPETGVTAMLDTPIHIRGELQGVLCLEQTGSRVLWTTTHRLFAHAVANLITLALVEYEASEARHQAQTARERLQAVFDASRDALLLADGESGVILEANRQAEMLFGAPHHQLVGKHQRQLHPPELAGEQSGEFSQVVSGERRSPVRTRILGVDGRVVPVEITTEVADIGDGRHLVLGIFRPL